MFTMGLWVRSKMFTSDLTNKGDGFQAIKKNQGNTLSNTKATKKGTWSQLGGNKKKKKTKKKFFLRKDD